MMKNFLVGLTLLCSLLSCTSSHDLKTLSDWRIKAEKAYQDGKYPEALNYYQKLSVAVPAEAELWFRLGNTYARMNRTDEAVKAYREAMLRDPYFSKAWYNAALNQLKSSSNTFLESLKYIPKNDPIYKMSESYYQKLLQLMDQQNVALGAMSKKDPKKSLDVNSVEMIVMDGKAGGLPQDLTQEDLISAVLEAPAADQDKSPATNQPEASDPVQTQPNSLSPESTPTMPASPPKSIALPISPSSPATPPAASSSDLLPLADDNANTLAQ